MHIQESRIDSTSDRADVQSAYLEMSRRECAVMILWLALRQQDLEAAEWGFRITEILRQFESMPLSERQTMWARMTIVEQLWTRIDGVVELIAIPEGTTPKQIVEAYFVPD